MSKENALINCYKIMGLINGLKAGPTRGKHISRLFKMVAKLRQGTTAPWLMIGFNQK